jgi:hypothetical protein
MTRTTRRWLALPALVLAGGLAATGQDEKPGSPLARFMRQKLAHSQGVLEGLTTEDYPLIAKGAKAMRELSEDTRWRVTPNPNYLRLSSEFQDLADELAQKAKEKNLDGATLAYVKLTMNCVKCHERVRVNRWITLRPQPPARHS